MFLAYLDRCFALLELYAHAKFNGSGIRKEGWGTVTIRRRL